MSEPADLTTKTTLLIDLDDTLYDYAPCERAAKACIVAVIAKDTGRAFDDVQNAWTDARDTVKKRLGHTGSAHSRLLYLAEMVYASGTPTDLLHIATWERAYWAEYMRVAKLRPFAIELLEAWRAKRGPIGIVTDLTLAVQLMKLQAFGLFERIDALVVSEEVPLNKPAPNGFVLAAERLGVKLETCVMVGDNPAKDGKGAIALGIPYLQAHESEGTRPGDLSIQQIGQKLGVFA